MSESTPRAMIGVFADGPKFSQGRIEGGVILDAENEAEGTENPTLKRLDDERQWYSQKSAWNQRWFKRLKAIEIIAAALIPFAAGLGASLDAFRLLGIGASVLITGFLGVLIVVLESLQSLYQLQSNWISYRSTAEGLKHEKYLWLAKAGPYLGAEDPDALLAERVESLISREHAKWGSYQERAGKTPASPKI